MTSISSHRQTPRVSLAVRLLHAIGRPVEEANQIGPTLHYTLDNALDYAKKTVPGFLSYIRGKDVLDYGCGPGWQALAMVANGARSAHGVDVQDKWIENGRRIARQHGLSDSVTYSYPWEIPDRPFDVCVSLGAFEHYADPEAELRRIVRAVKPGGLVILLWAEPWYSPHGSHLSSFFRLPWLNLLFSERTLMEARRRYRSDGATHFHEVAGGLNRMTVARYERAIRDSGCRILDSHLFAVRGLPFVTRIPVVRELLTSGCSCVLQRPEESGSQR
jgi:SAM-dependent methyltransferase